MPHLCTIESTPFPRGRRLSREGTIQQSHHADERVRRAHRLRLTSGSQRAQAGDGGAWRHKTEAKQVQQWPAYEGWRWRLRRARRLGRPLLSERAHEGARRSRRERARRAVVRPAVRLPSVRRVDEVEVRGALRQRAVLRVVSA